LYYSNLSPSPSDLVKRFGSLDVMAEVLGWQSLGPGSSHPNSIYNI
jgi:hypothetical protein